MAVRQKLAMVPVAELWVGENVRDDVGDIDSLAESIAQVGVLEPLVIWPSEDGSHPEVGLGQRRLAAAKKAGLVEVPCILRSRPGERDRILLQIAENHERAEMSPIDEARAFRALIHDHHISQRAIARSLHKTDGWVYGRLKLLELPATLRDAVHQRTLPPSTALEFPLALAADKDAMQSLAKIGVLYLTREAFRAWVKDQYRRRRHTAPVVRRGVRSVPVTMDAYELARERARAEGMTLGEWATAAIQRHAKASR